MSAGWSYVYDSNSEVTSMGKSVEQGKSCPPPPPHTHTQVWKGKKMWREKVEEKREEDKGEGRRGKKKETKG